MTATPNSFFWNTNLGTMPWQMPFSSPWGFSGTSTEKTSDSRPETYEEYQKRLAKERELAAAEIKIRTAKRELSEQYEKSITEIDKSKEQVNKSKNPDGSATVVVPRKKKESFWNKAGRWLCNAGTALKNIGKSFIGIDENGKFNLGKCLKNVAITAAAIGATLIPGVGPVIGYGMLAAGVIGGGIGVAKGVSKLNNAKTDAEKDKAQQEICTNAFVGITSALGLRGMGKAFRTGAATSAQASSAASRTSMAGKAIESSSNFVRDITVNATRATSNAARQDIALVNANGFANTYKSKAAEAWKSVTSWKQRYDTKYSELKKSVDTRLSKVNEDISKLNELAERGPLTSSDQQRLALLKEERHILTQNQKELNTFFGKRTKEKNSYDKLLSKNSGVSARERIVNRNASEHPNRIQEIDIPDEQLAAFYKRINAEQKQYSQSLKELVKLKENVMRTLAKHPDDNAIELSKYIRDINVQRNWYKASQWVKNDYQLAIGGHNPRNYGEYMGIALTAPASNVPKALGGWVDPMYSGPMLLSQDFTPEQVEQLLQELEAQEKELEAALATVKELKNEEELNAYKAQLEMAAQAQKEAQEQTQEQAEQEQTKEKE